MQNHSLLRNGGKYIYTRKNTGQTYPVIIRKIHKNPVGTVIAINQSNASTGILETIRSPSKYKNIYLLRGGKYCSRRSQKRGCTRKLRR